MPVPLDRANPAAGTIDIAYALAAALRYEPSVAGHDRPEPGRSRRVGERLRRLYLKAFAPLRARRDLLLIDVRGTGQSGPLTLPDPDRPGRPGSAVAR